MICDTEHGLSLFIIKLIVKNAMKKTIIGLVIGLSLGISGAAFATTLKTIGASSYVMTISAMPTNSVKKFVDGSVTCYILQNGNQGGISCVK